MPTKLTDEQIEHMDDLLERVLVSLQKKRGEKVFIKDVSELFGSNLYQREVFTFGTYQRFVRWCAEDQNVRIEDGNRRNSEPSLFTIDLAKSSLQEQHVFESAVEEYSGKYLLVTWVGTRKARVTWLDLKDVGPSTMPTFEARRENLVFYGVYYLFEESLFLFGHKQLSPMSRSIFLTRLAEGGRKHLVGIVSGASNDKKIFASSCYAHALPNDASFEAFEDHIGFKHNEEIFKKFPLAKTVFEKHGAVQMEIARTPDD